MDSNHDKGLQRALCYRYTIGHAVHKLPRSNATANANIGGELDVNAKMVTHQADNFPDPAGGLVRRSGRASPRTIDAGAIRAPAPECDWPGRSTAGDAGSTRFNAGGCHSGHNLMDRAGDFSRRQAEAFSVAFRGRERGDPTRPLNSKDCNRPLDRRATPYFELFLIVDPAAWGKPAWPCPFPARTGRF
jgi:hypothetical protein